MSRKRLQAIVMTVWGGFLTWFAASGTMARFLGPRTYWVAWFGGVALLIAGLMALVASRTGSAPRRSDIIGAALMLLPIILVVVLPEPQLGAQAASLKAVGVGALSSFVPAADPDGEIGLQEIRYANLSVEYADSLGITDGLEVELIGFVTHPAGTEPGGFGLTRFYISCCAADAVPHTVAVRASDGESFVDDTWLRVEGSLVHSEAGFVLQADLIEPVDEPSAPYLY